MSEALQQLPRGGAYIIFSDGPSLTVHNPVGLEQWLSALNLNQHHLESLLKLCSLSSLLSF